MEPTPNNNLESLTLKTSINPNDAIAQLGQALGKSDMEIAELFPGLSEHKGQIHLDILKANRNPEGQKKGDMVVITGLGGTRVSLFYGYYPDTGEVINMIELRSRDKIRQVIKSWESPSILLPNPSDPDEGVSTHDSLLRFLSKDILIPKSSDPKIPNINKKIPNINKPDKQF